MKRSRRPDSASCGWHARAGRCICTAEHMPRKKHRTRQIPRTSPCSLAMQAIWDFRPTGLAVRAELCFGLASTGRLLHRNVGQAGHSQAGHKTRTRGRLVTPTQSLDSQAGAKPDSVAADESVRGQRASGLVLIPALRRGLGAEPVAALAYAGLKAGARSCRPSNPVPHSGAAPSPRRASARLMAMANGPGHCDHPMPRACAHA